MQFAVAWCCVFAAANAAKTQLAVKALVQDNVKSKDLPKDTREGALGGSVSIASLVTDKNASNATDAEPVELVPPVPLAAAPAGPGPEFAPMPAPAAAPMAAPAPAPAPAKTSGLWSWLPWFLSPSSLWDYIFGSPTHTPATLAQIKHLDEAVFAPAPVRESKKDGTFAPAPMLNSSFLEPSTSREMTQPVTEAEKSEERELGWWSWLWPFQSEEKPDQKDSILEELRVRTLAGGVAMKP
mmetsp:Transcript_49812/g.79400  ORF Transcript_49812/g.79400 Transcript_49812/m.79400 type:complete len:240 (-) Transcript_49812:108-827(-)